MKDLKRDRMELALDEVHTVFIKHASASPRFLALQQPSPVMLDMQRQSYRMGSRSAVVVAERARAANHFFLDIAAFKWRPEAMTPFRLLLGSVAVFAMARKRQQLGLAVLYIWSSMQLTGICIFLIHLFSAR